jgi:hypothetical protein
MVCGTCGSADVGADASARWNAAEQEWELTTTYDKGSSCEVCEGECRIEEIPLDEYQANLTKGQDMHSIHLDIEVEVGVRQLGDDEDKWVAIVSESDVGEIFKGSIIWSSPDDAKDAARRWAIHGKETGSF